MNNWEFTSSAVGAFNNAEAFGFGMIGVAYRFSENEVGALSYTPTQEFLLQFDNTSIHTEAGGLWPYPSALEFRDRFRIGFARRLSDEVALGISGRWVEEFLRTPGSGYLQSPGNSASYRASLWSFNLGFSYNVNASVKTGALIDNILAVREAYFPDHYRQFEYRPEKIVRIGGAYKYSRELTFTAEVNSRFAVVLGYEQNNVFDLPDFTVRQGFWMTTSSNPIEALSIGLGYSYKTVQFDAAYVHFLGQRVPSNGILPGSFQPLSSLHWNPYTTNQITASVTYAYRSGSEPLVRIEDVQFFSMVFPVNYRVHAMRPLGYARVRNTTDKTVSARLSFFVPKLMSMPTNTSQFYLNPHEIRDIPFTAEFNENILSVHEESFRDARIAVMEAEVNNYTDIEYKKVLILGRNFWNGDPLMLKYFVTPDEPRVKAFARKALYENIDFLESLPPERQPLEKARLVFNRLANLLSYYADEKTFTSLEEFDRVQYPSETLDLRGGDCDDLTVCYSALMNSLGFETAFVDVRYDSVDENGDNAHIYLLVDTKLPAYVWSSLTSNERKLVVRRNSTNRETLWIPVEPTLITKGFDAAWEQGALEYYRDVELMLGQLRGNVKIVDVY
ncbi:MAG: hypothetical protein GXO82_02565 [Chlorobi bacterium]|nr:hypothetical protein [Chlorobiota bacterium]